LQYFYYKDTILNENWKLQYAWCLLPGAGCLVQVAGKIKKWGKINVLFLQSRNLNTNEDYFSCRGTSEFHEDCTIYKGYQ